MNTDTTKYTDHSKRLNGFIQIHLTYIVSPYESLARETTTIYRYMDVVLQARLCVANTLKKMGVDLISVAGP